MKIYRILDLIILLLVCLFVVGMLGSSFPRLTPDVPVLSISEEIQTLFELLIYPIIVLLIIDLSLKYRETKNPKKFVKKYWIDIFMLCMIPVFSILKFLKIGITLVKHLKSLKMRSKIIHKTKKLQKNNFKILQK